jgi:hypothetical protein
VTFVFDGFYAIIHSGIGCGKVGQESQKLETQRAQSTRRKADQEKLLLQARKKGFPLGPL